MYKKALCSLLVLQYEGLKCVLVVHVFTQSLISQTVCEYKSDTHCSILISLCDDFKPDLFRCSKWTRWWNAEFPCGHFLLDNYTLPQIIPTILVPLRAHVTAHMSVSGYLNTGRTCARIKGNSGRSAVKWRKVGVNFRRSCFMWWRLYSPSSACTLSRTLSNWCHTLHRCQRLGLPLLRCRSWRRSSLTIKGSLLNIPERIEWGLLCSYIKK
jgi:hypothetical protein